MKKMMITLAGAMTALATYGQAVLQVETESETVQYIYTQKAEISFWGLPEGDEANSDLTVAVDSVFATRAYVSMRANASTAFKDVGLCITETENVNPEYANSWVKNGNDASVKYSSNTPFYTMKEKGDISWSVFENCFMPGKTYYVKPYALWGEKLMFGSEKAIVMPWTLKTLLTELDIFGNWYINTDFADVQGEYIVPTAKAWESLCSKYQAYLGENPSDAMRKSLTTAWFNHLTPAEADLMKSHSVAYFDNCEDGKVYVVDRVCDDLIPSLLTASADIDLTKPNLDEDERGLSNYTKNCSVQVVECDASYGIEGNKYVKIEPSSKTVNPSVGYDLPFALLPNRIYNVSVTIAPDTENFENALPNLFRVQLYKGEARKITNIVNPAASGNENTNVNLFEYGGQKLDTFTFTIDTHDESMAESTVLGFVSNISSKQTATNSRTIRIAKISIAPVMENAVAGDVDLDGTLNQDDVQSVAAAVVLNTDNGEEPSEEKPSTDFTGDGKTLIDDVVALVNFIQTGEFKPTSSKERARYASAKAPAFATDKNVQIIMGEDATLSVEMSDMSDYTAVSFDIKLPEGVKVATDKNGKPMIALGDIATSTHQIVAAAREDGKTIRMSCYANDNAPFAKNEGSVITINLMKNLETEGNEEALISITNGMVTKRSLASVVLDEYTINAGIVLAIEEMGGELTSDVSTIIGYYTIDGIQIARPKKGVNLVRMSDGTVKKVFVK